VTLRETWDAQAAEWTRFARDPRGDSWNPRFNLPRFLELLPPRGRRALDLGCGEGRLARALAARGYAVVGVDSSAAMVAAASETVEAVVADAGSLPFDDGAFDLVAAFMSLHDMDDLDNAVRETARVLEPRGRFCFAVVHPFVLPGRFESREESARFLIRGSYLDSHRRDDLVERDGFRVNFAAAHRPIESYSRALEQAGFVTERLREVRYEGDDSRRHRVPSFLHLRAARL